MKKSIIVTLASLFTAIFSLGISTGVQKVSAETNSIDLSKIVNTELVAELGYDPTLNYLGIGSEADSSGLYRIRGPVEYTVAYVYTPNGSQVQVYDYIDDLSSDTISDYNSQFDDLYQDAVRLSSSTRYYNCHSYAWYQSMTSNPYWMDDPSAYYTDGSYYEVTVPQAGDIICYYTSGGFNLHSGAVVEVDNNTITVESKWGKCGLYRHEADYCPYMPEYGGQTQYVKYYRHSEHTYNQECVYVDVRNHKTYCLCGDSTLSMHSIRAGESTGRYARCIGCGAKLDLWSEIYPVVPYSVPQDREGSYILPNGIAVIAEEDMGLFDRGQLIIDGYLVV